MLKEYFDKFCGFMGILVMIGVVMGIVWFNTHSAEKNHEYEMNPLGNSLSLERERVNQTRMLLEQYKGQKIPLPVAIAIANGIRPSARPGSNTESVAVPQDKKFACSSDWVVMDSLWASVGVNTKESGDVLVLGRNECALVRYSAAPSPFVGTGNYFMSSLFGEKEGKKFFHNCGTDKPNGVENSYKDNCTQFLNDHINKIVRISNKDNTNPIEISF